MTDRSVPRLFCFRVRLSAQPGFFLVSTYAASETAAQEQLQGRYGGKIAEFRPKDHEKRNLGQE